MFVAILSLIYMCFISFTLGLLVKRVMSRVIKADIDMIMALGIMASTVYAQSFSIFYRVNIECNIILLLISLVSLILCREDVKELFERARNSDIEVVRYRVFLLVILILFVAAISATEPLDYDSYLYHNQAIQWIERYGLVKGLGNLHHRFAYNSAMMSLQALFGFSFIGRSIHQVNGFICLLALYYVFCDLYLYRKAELLKKEFRASYIIKASMFFYILLNLQSISSPGTDFAPTIFFMYICGKWQEACEDKRQQTFYYLAPSLLAVFCVTLKLSVLPIAFLTFYLLYELLKKNKTKQAVIMLVGDLVIVLPYLIRNVIISGYLLYPMEKLDLFKVDWKMPKALVSADREEIKLCGREILHQSELNSSLKAWVQVWFKSLNLIERGIFCLTLLMICLVILSFIYKRFIKGNSKPGEVNEVYLQRESVLLTVLIIAFFYWFLSAPSIRFGMGVLLCLIAVAAGLLFGNSVKGAYTGMLFVFSLITLTSYSDGLMLSEANLIYPTDYKQFECEEVSYETKKGDSIIIYRPKEGDQSGYDVFPESPDADPKYLRLRGDSLKDGFMAIAE
ncbi:MAG: hypothetical protein K5931_02710 [Lachnospiraceae bacterium]|nr:hypothetical protein [Lachnospiraceae bacterium]